MTGGLSYEITKPIKRACDKIKILCRVIETSALGFTLSEGYLPRVLGRHRCECRHLLIGYVNG